MKTRSLILASLTLAVVTASAAVLIEAQATAAAAIPPAKIQDRVAQTPEGCGEAAWPQPPRCLVGASHSNRNIRVIVVANPDERPADSRTR